MNEIETVVTALDGKYALVAAPKEGCGHCDEPGGCGKGNLNPFACSSSRAFRVLNAVEAKPGDHVVVAVADNAVNIGVLLLYGVPLCLLLLGTTLGAWLGNNDLAAIGGGISGLIAAWGIVTILLKKKTGNSFFQPYILLRLPPNEPGRF